MKKIILILVLFLVIVSLITFGCSKTENPSQPTQTPTPLPSFTPTSTNTLTPLPSFTPTCTNTLTGNVVMLDNFSDGDLLNNYGNEWSPYWPFAGQWVSTPTITTGYADYALKVTGHVTANAVMPPSYYGLFGTTTYINNGSGTDIRPVNYINLILKTIENIPNTNIGFFDKILISLFTPNNSSYANYEISPMPSSSWQVYKININNFTFDCGDASDLFSHMGFIGIYIYYTSTISNEEAEAELYVDEVYFSEN